MRWENLSLDREDEGADAKLPGFRDPARVRTFDAPEALGTRFYEVGARSILNRVPERSRMPFRWTINPYRGCSHACAYCVSGDTQILLADGRSKRMDAIEVDDRVVGTKRIGRYRRYAEATVTDHWATGRRPAYRVTLADGTELIASADHRFLTDRGWKHVLDAPGPGSQRPHLTLNNRLLGFGSIPPAPDHDADYRAGYLCGMIRGDGSLGHYRYKRPGRTSSDVYRFRLALIDFDALDRTKRYLSREGIDCGEFLFQPAGAIGSSREVRAIRTGRRSDFETISRLIEWPATPSDSWVRGYLGGDPGGPDRVRSVRIRGRLNERLRFLSVCDSAVARKRTIVGSAVKLKADLRVVSIEPVGEQSLWDMTTSTGDFVANGVISHNCFARPTHKFLDFGAGRDFEREIVVKTNAPERLRAELAKPSWNREHVALGTNTDPYQWVEGRYRLMVGIWEAMRDFANPCSVLTKSPLLLRDLDLMKQIAAGTEFHANLSIPTLDERAWRETEPHTPNPRKRLEAVAALNEAGIPTGILIAPLMPGINDSPAQVEEILRLAAEAGATNVGGIGLHLRGETREVFFDWLAEFRPDLIELYERLYSRGAYLPKPERERLAKLARGRHPPRRFLREVGERAEASEAGGRGTAVPREATQPGLF
ncbi:radical SAM protein [Thermoleophilia bacterium SCSIO 60948]|nr:radical SAM protein [Thermoleophilia bacterium SCSIO 60948]